MKLIGDNHSRHGDWREMMFEITLCVPNIDKKKTCVENPLEELKKMELIFLYNSERFNRKDFSTDPIIRESVIEHYLFDPEKKYELKPVIT